MKFCSIGRAHGVVVPSHHFIARVALKLRTRRVMVQQCRVGVDTTSFLHVGVWL